MDCSTPGLPVHHHLLEFTQTHVHWVSDAIQPSHPLSYTNQAPFNLQLDGDLFKISGLLVFTRVNIRTWAGLLDLGTVVLNLGHIPPQLKQNLWRQKLAAIFVEFPRVLPKCNHVWESLLWASMSQNLVCIKIPKELNWSVGSYSVVRRESWEPKFLMWCFLCCILQAARILGSLLNKHQQPYPRWPALNQHLSCFSDRMWYGKEHGQGVRSYLCSLQTIFCCCVCCLVAQLCLTLLRPHGL